MAENWPLFHRQPLLHLAGDFSLPSAHCIRQVGKFQSTCCMKIKFVRWENSSPPGTHCIALYCIAGKFQSAQHMYEKLYFANVNMLSIHFLLTAVHERWTQLDINHQSSLLPKPTGHKPSAKTRRRWVLRCNFLVSGAIHSGSRSRVP